MDNRYKFTEKNKYFDSEDKENILSELDSLDFLIKHDLFEEDSNWNNATFYNSGYLERDLKLIRISCYDIIDKINDLEEKFKSQKQEYIDFIETQKAEE